MEWYHWFFIFAAVALLGLVVDVAFYRDKRQAKQRREMALLELSEENVRISQLPPLNTQWLIRVPEEVACKFYDQPENRPKRSWSSRYTHLVIFDEKGQVWLGYFMPQTFTSMARGEYIRREYYVPFRGAGEAYAGKPVEVDGKTCEVYPVWYNEWTPYSDWLKFISLEEVSQATARGYKDVYDIQKSCYPVHERKAADQIRKYYEDLLGSLQTA